MAGRGRVSNLIPRPPFLKRKGVRGVRSAGFTLIELVVVIFTVTVISSMVFPSFPGFYREQRLRWQARHLMTLVLKARQEAIDRDTIVTLTFDPAARRFALLVEPDPQQLAGGNAMPGEGMAPQNTDTGPVADYSRPLPDGMTARIRRQARYIGMDADRSDPVRFYPDGHADAAQILVGYETGRILAVFIIRNTARPYLVDARTGEEIE